MTTTLQSLREKFSRRIGDYREGTTTAAGTASNATVIDSVLGNKVDDFYNSFYIVITSGTCQATERQISDFVQSGGVLTTSVAFTAQIAASCTYELHRSSPGEKDTLIKEAIRQIYPDLHKPVIDESLISGNHLWDGDFEKWTSAAVPTYYAENSGMTPAQESTTKRFGTYSMKLTSGATNAYRGQSNSDNPALLDLGGQTVTFKAWCNASDASHARLHIYTLDKGATAQNEYSDYHTGSGRWELLEVELALNDDLRTIAFRFHGDVDTKIAYWDYARVTGPYKFKYLLPPTIERLAQVWLQAEANVETDEDPCDDLNQVYPMIELIGWRILDDGTNRFLLIPYAHNTGRKLRLIGTTFLTQPTSDSATIEIDEPKTDLLVAQAAYMLHTLNLGTQPADEVSRSQNLAAFWKSELAEQKRYHRMLVPSKPFPSGA